MAIGVYAAAEMVWPELNFGVPWLSFSRIRPDHTFGVIFGFGGSALMGTGYYVVQRTGHTRLALGGLANFTFWGWQLGCVLAGPVGAELQARVRARGLVARDLAALVIDDAQVHLGEAFAREGAGRVALTRFDRQRDAHALAVGERHVERAVERREAAAHEAVAEVSEPLLGRHLIGV